MRHTDLEKISTAAIAAVIISAVLILQPWTWRVAGDRATMYTSTEYRVSFEYPADWQPVPGTGGYRFEGSDGFFELGAATEDISASVLAGPAEGSELPYGSSPVVQEIRAGGEQGGIVVPSSDQSTAMRHQAVLVVSYPEPVSINGRTYQYFLLWADKQHIRGFADSLRFLRD